MADMQKKITSILIANRSEISLRIQSSCEALGIKTVAIYTKEDESLSFVSEATEAYQLSHSGTHGYMDQEEIIAIAKKAKVDAIHPGYGFLSESAVFAQKVLDANIIWIGPAPKVISQLGSKSNASRIMADSGVPTLPHKAFFDSPEQKLIAKETAANIGYPIILKASLGGGGRGMEKVEKPSEFDQAWSSVASAGKRFFDSSDILLEKYIDNARHIEVQIAGDGKNFVHLFERECSVQRRRQKIIEETPCTFINRATKEKLYDAAIKAAKTVQCDNISTIEFLVTPDESFFFMEMNPRLQVEHAVTEMITGIDLVSLQIKIAETKKLPLKQNDVLVMGHALECRIYSEKPEENFSPSTGKIEVFQIPNDPFSRIEHDLYEGINISSFFDPMIAKIITHGCSRNDTIERMNRILSKLTIYGIDTNINFLQELIASDHFLRGKMHTQYLNNKVNVSTFFKEQNSSSSSDNNIALCLLSLLEKTQKTTPKTPQKSTPNNWKSKQWQ